MMKQTKLQNGIPVIIDRMEGTKVVTAYILFSVGSRHETKKTNGISHFLEHLFFKGTEKRPTTLALSRELDGVGADFNAFTSKDYTGYYVKLDSRHTTLALDILEDLLFHPLFEAEEIERERGVIVEEINMYEDNPMSIADELSEQLLFGKDHPLGYRITGPIENIKRVTRKEILDYRTEHYHPGSMVIVLTGDVPKNAMTQLNKMFGSAEHPKKPLRKPKKFVFTQKQPRIQIEKKSTAQAHLSLAFPGPAYRSKDELPAKLLSTILGGSMSSRLFINIRERMGLCYYIGSTVSPYEDQGAFAVFAGFDRTRIQDAITAIVDEIRSIRDNGVTDEELAQAKEYIRGKMSIRMEDSENVAGFWARQFLHAKELRSQEQMSQALEKITAKDLKKFAQKYLKQEFANLVVVGNYSEKQQASFLKTIKQL